MKPAYSEKSLLKDMANQDMNRTIDRLNASSQQPANFEPYQRPAQIIGTISTLDELKMYQARMGMLGNDMYTLALRAAGEKPELAAYFPEYSVAKESLALAEESRDQSGSPSKQKTENPPNKRAAGAKNSYNESAYSYKGYASKTDYFKNTKKIYAGLAETVKGAFKKIRSVYQSSSGVLGNKPDYAGRAVDSKTNEKIAALDFYRNKKQGIGRETPIGTDEDLETRLAA